MTVPRVVLLPSVRAVAVIEGLCSSVGVAGHRSPLNHKAHQSWVHRSREAWEAGRGHTEVLDWGLSIPAATDARLRRD